MCVVMCVGGGLLALVRFQAADSLGWPDLAQKAPELSAGLVTICLALPMAVYMKVRGHARRHNLEMTGTTLAVGAIVICLLWFGVIAADSLRGWRSLFGMICPPACLVMIIEMLVGFRTYGGHANQWRTAESGGRIDRDVRR